MRAEHPHVHRNPLPTLVTIAKRPSGGGGMGGYNHGFPKNGSGIFSRESLKWLITLKQMEKSVFWRRLFYAPFDPAREATDETSIS